jgi:hypothetical protein
LNPVNTRRSRSPTGSSRPASTHQIGSVGDAYDNALAESTIGLFKTEAINPDGPWRDAEHVEIDTLDWVHWFNTERPHESIDDLTPAFVEQIHYAARNQLTSTGRATKPSLQTHRGGSPRRVFAAAGMQWAGTHTFRRTVATWMDEAGHSLASIANQLGHADINITARYLGRQDTATHAAAVMVLPSKRSNSHLQAV